MKIKNVSKSVDGRRILSDISLDFPNTGMVFIIGKSGSGKTTLINILSGIDREYEGNIEIFDGENLNTYNEDNYRSSTVGVIHQDFNLINSLTVKENIILGGKISGIECDNEQINAVAERLKIEKLMDREVVALSGGERQRIAIARTLLREDKIVCADEPTGNLDNANAKEFFDYLKEISNDRLCIVVTHDLEFARNYGDRIIEISDGKVIKDEVIRKIEKRKTIRNELKLANSKWQFSYAIKGIKKRYKKMLGIISILSIAMLCVVFILGFSSTVSKSVKNIDTVILENDKFYLNKINTEEDLTIGDEIINIFEKENKIKKVESFYGEEINVKYKEIEERVEYQVIDDSDFYTERYSEIKGDFPNASNEVMVNSGFANMLFGTDDCIGKEFLLYADTATEIRVKVSALKTVSIADDISELYITKELSNKIFNSVKLNTLKVYEDINQEPIYGEGRIYASQEIVYGRKPENNREIVFAIDNENIKSFSESMLNKKVILKTVIGSEINIGTYEIVGICKSEDIISYIYFNEKAMEENAPANKMIIYVDSLAEDVINRTENLAEEHNLYMEQHAKFKGNTIRNRISSIVVILMIISVIVIIIAAMMTHYFMKISIIQRQYEIGVLRCLGAEKKSIRNVLMFEQIVIGFLVILIVGAITGVLNIMGVMSSIKMEGLQMYTFEWWHLLIVTTISIVSIVIFSIRDVFKAANMNIVDALREKYKI